MIQNICQHQCLLEPNVILVISSIYYISEKTGVMWYISTITFVKFLVTLNSFDTALWSQEKQSDINNFDKLKKNKFSHAIATKLLFVTF